MQEKEKRRKKKNNLPFMLLFLFGFAILIYPLVSRMYYRVEVNEQIVNFDREKGKLIPEEVNRRILLAKAFNESLNNVITEDPYARERIKQGRAEYARMLEINEQIGHIQIPKIDIDIPIYAGTVEEVLQKGAGHLEGTSLPVGGNSTHAVITAHSGLPTATLFTDLRKMEVGDKFYIHNLAETLAYQVDWIKVIEPSNFNDLVIFPGHDYVTLLTCTPLMINTHRLLVRGHRVEYVPAVEERIIAENRTKFMYKYLFYAACFVIFILLFLIWTLRKKKKQVEKKYKRLYAIIPKNEEHRLSEGKNSGE